MATFTNQATLSYNGTVTNSNIITGELQEALSATKYAALESYTSGGDVAYVINIINSGTTAFSGISVSDNLGSYTVGANTVVPLSYRAGSVKFFVDGVLQAAPTVTAGPPLVFSGLNIPAGSNAAIVYEAAVNQYAPMAVGGVITNEATVSGTGVTPSIVAAETVTADAAAMLSITKSLSPAVVTENGQLTYTFTIQNMGNTAATVADNVILTDTFNPILNNISVSYNGTAWSPTVNYTYNTATGLFSTVTGQITVPAATYTQDPVTGAWSVEPGVSTLTVTGTV